MKKYLLSVIMGSFLLLLFGFQQTIAQDSKSSKVHITITEDNQVTIDTTFELAEGQDPEMIKKMVSHMAGGEFHTQHMSQDVHEMHLGDDAHGQHNVMTFIECEDHGDELMEHTVIIHSDGEGDGKEKKIEVIVHRDEDSSKDKVEVEVEVKTDKKEKKKKK